MQETKKLKRAALVLGVVTGILLLIYLFNTIRMVRSWELYDLEPDFFGGLAVSPGICISGAVGQFIFIATLIITLTMFISIWRGETPFKRGIVNRLRIIALLLVVHEIHNFIIQRIHPLRFYMGEDNFVEIRTSFHGYVIVAGLAIFCVSLILQYGITLQTQVDETL